MSLKNCIPKDKFDTAAIEQASLIGFPKLNPIIPDLLVWVQDANWPVAASTASLLSNAGCEIVPHVKAILNSKDQIWKYWTLDLVVKNLSLDLLTKLRGDLVRLAYDPTQEEQLEEVDVAAQEILTT